MSMKYLFILTAICGSVSCEQNPKLELRQEFTLSVRELTNRSSVVLVGTISSVESLGRRFRVGELIVQLSRVRISVEKVLKGNVPNKGTAGFWRYVWSGDTLPKDELSADFYAPGMRSIFFLDNEGDRLRSTVDVVQSRVGLMEGKLDGRVPEPGTGVHEMVAKLLLSTGIDQDPEAFARSLANSAYYSIELIGKLKTLHLLRDLVNGSVGQVKTMACFELSGRFAGQDECLHELLQHFGTESWARRLAERQLSAGLKRDSSIKIELEKDPERWLNGHARSRDRVDIKDELRVLAIHADPGIRRIACNCMSQQFPDEPLPECWAEE